jgi:fluoride exporter
MMQVLTVAAGGAVGSVLRYVIQKWLNLSFPFGTLAVNIIGCFFAGWLMAMFIKGISSQTYLFLMTGFCGGFTTFSAFGSESVQMLLTDRWAYFFLYVMISVAGGLLATFLAYKFFSS